MYGIPHIYVKLSAHIIYSNGGVPARNSSAARKNPPNRVGWFGLGVAVILFRFLAVRL